MTQRYVHGFGIREQERLSALNELLNDSFSEGVAAFPCAHIGDFGCGTGHMLRTLADRVPACRLTGLERDPSQYQRALQTTEPYDNIEVRNESADATSLPDNALDIAYCRCVLEHVPDPIAVIREMIRVTKPGGRIIAQENDLEAEIYYPPVEGYVQIREAFCKRQEVLGGDPYIGRKLYSLFKEAGLEDLHFTLVPEVHTADEPDTYRAWLSNHRQIIESARGRLIEDGLVDEREIDHLLAALAARIANPQGAVVFYWNRVTGRKPGESGSTGVSQA